MTHHLTSRINKIIKENPSSKAIFLSMVEFLEKFGSVHQQSLDLDVKPSLKAFTNTELKGELLKRESEILVYPMLLDGFINGFNQMKKSLTGIKSRYSSNNKAIKAAWVKFTYNKTEEQAQEILSEMVGSALYGLCNDEWHKENYFKYITPDFLLRADKLEKWANVGKVKYNRSKTHKLDLDKEKAVTNN
jgi:hypothetical protein